MGDRIALAVVIFCAMVLVALIFFAEAQNSRFVQGRASDMIRSVYDRVPEGIRDHIFGLMESLSGSSVVNASDKIKEEAATTVEAFIQALGPILDHAIQTGELDNFTILQQRMMGDRDGEDLTRFRVEQLRRDRAEDAKAKKEPATRTNLMEEVRRPAIGKRD